MRLVRNHGTASRIGGSIGCPFLEAGHRVITGYGAAAADDELIFARYGHDSGGRIATFGRPRYTPRDLPGFSIQRREIASAKMIR